MSERMAVGVDAGGTVTGAALSCDGRYEATAHAGPANPSSQGVAAASATIVAVVQELLGDRDLAALFVAAAGAGRRTVRAELVEALRKAFPTTALAVEDDTRVALRAAIPAGPGVVLIAGTGSIAYAENGDRCVRVGGNGYLLGDEGSAFAIGLAALKVLARTYDGRAVSDEMSELVARTLGTTERAELLAILYEAPLAIARIAALAPSVIALAGNGNRASAKIVQGAALELADLLRHAVRQSGIADATPSLALSGGLLRENSLLTFLLEARAINETPGATIVRARDEPVRAALRFAEALPV